jgi:FKBP-type peptidyl-prolyl cis-trans isomerase
MNKKQMETKLQELERELEKQKSTPPALPSDISAADVVKYFIADREATNQLFRAMAEQVKGLREAVNEAAMESQSQEEYATAEPKEIPLSAVDAKIIEFIQTRPKGMASAEDVRVFMHYKGKNAACARLTMLYRMNVLERMQLGHKVYYKFDAGKATIQLIVSPPQ